VDWQVFRRLATGSIPAAILTLALIHWTGASRSQGGLIVHALGAVLMLTAAAMIFKRRFHAIGQDLRTRLPADFKRAQPALTVMAGAILGVLVTLTSIGAGALGAVMLLYLYPFRMKPTTLVGTRSFADGQRGSPLAGIVAARIDSRRHRRLSARIQGAGRAAARLHRRGDGGRRRQDVDLRGSAAPGRAVLSVPPRLLLQ